MKYLPVDPYELDNKLLIHCMSEVKEMLFGIAFGGFAGCFFFSGIFLLAYFFDDPIQFHQIRLFFLLSITACLSPAIICGVIWYFTKRYLQIWVKSWQKEVQENENALREWPL